MTGVLTTSISCICSGSQQGVLSTIQEYDLLLGDWLPTVSSILGLLLILSLSLCLLLDTFAVLSITLYSLSPLLAVTAYNCPAIGATGCNTCLQRPMFDGCYFCSPSQGCSGTMCIAGQAAVQRCDSPSILSVSYKP